MAELAELENGDRVLLRNLGWTDGWVGGYASPTIDETISAVEMVTLPDEGPPGCEPDPEPHPWEWLATLAGERGLSVTAEQLKELPYKIYLSDRLLKFCS